MTDDEREFSDYSRRLLSLRALATVLYGRGLGPMPASLVVNLDFCRRGEYRGHLSEAMSRPWVTNDPTIEELRGKLNR